jgi:hypothetical protein
MTLIGYTMMCEQAGPKQLVRDVALAEQPGFDFKSSAITTSRGSTRKVTRRTRGACSARRRRRRTAFR